MAPDQLSTLLKSWNLKSTTAMTASGGIRLSNLDAQNGDKSEFE